MARPPPDPRPFPAVHDARLGHARRRDRERRRGVLDRPSRAARHRRRVPAALTRRPADLTRSDARSSRSCGCSRPPSSRPGGVARVTVRVRNKAATASTPLVWRDHVPWQERPRTPRAGRRSRAGSTNKRTVAARLRPASAAPRPVPDRTRSSSSTRIRSGWPDRPCRSGSATAWSSFRRSPSCRRRARSWPTARDRRSSSSAASAATTTT